MGNEIEKFDPSTLMQGIKDRIKATFVSLIPDDQWEQMVKTEIHKYFEKKGEAGYRRNEATEFEIMVRHTLDEECRKRIITYLSSPEFDVTWNNTGYPVCTETMKKMLIDNSGDILANMMGGMFASMLQNFKQSLQNGNRY